MDNKTYAPLHSHSYYSLLDGLCSPQDMAKRASEIGCPAMGLTDHGTLSGMVQFDSACKKFGIKPLIGCEIYVCKDDPSLKTKENNKRYHLTLLAKNPDGVKSLMRLVSETNRPDYFYRKPRISLEKIRPFTKDGNIICLSGCLAGELSSSLFSSLKEASLIGTSTGDKNSVKDFLIDGWKENTEKIIRRYQSVFGKENFFIELQTEGMTVQDVVVDCLRDASKALDVPSVATLDSHYCGKQDAEDHRILLYAQLHTTAEEQERIRNSGGDTMAFFYLDTFHILNYDEMSQSYSDKEIEKTLEIADMVRPTKFKSKPRLPKSTDGDANQKLKDICIDRAKTKLSHLSGEDKKTYWERLLKELGVIKDVGFADYFLIVSDVCDHIDSKKWPRGKGRGSGAGSLVNFLTGITGIDPIKYGLYFERFFNHGRCRPSSTSFEELPLGEFLEDSFPDEDSEFYEFIKSIADQAKKVEVKDSAHFRAELSMLKDLRVMRYYRHIIDNVKISKDNKENSYVMWIVGKVNKIDTSKPPAIIEGIHSLPDIDLDVSRGCRNSVIEYVIKRWGEDKVCQMITFGRLQGKAALKEVFRTQPETVKQLIKVRELKLGRNPDDVHVRSVDVCNEITKHIPDEAAISDELRQIRTELGNDNYGILRWAVDHIEFVGEQYKWFKPLFDQAMRIEGVKKNQSRHAAGVIVSDCPVADLFPLTYDTNSKTRVCGLEMSDAEEVGGVKFDFLAVSALDKTGHIQDQVNLGV